MKDHFREINADVLDAAGANGASANADAIAGASPTAVALTEDTFDLHVGRAVPALVLFYAPLCEHSRDFAPYYEQVAHAYRRDMPWENDDGGPRPACLAADGTLSQRREYSAL